MEEESKSSNVIQRGANMLRFRREGPNGRLLFIEIIQKFQNRKTKAKIIPLLSKPKLFKETFFLVDYWAIFVPHNGTMACTTLSFL